MPPKKEEAENNGISTISGCAKTAHKLQTRGVSSLIPM